MARAIMDPEEVRRFAAELKRLTTSVTDQLTLMHAKMNDLGQTWRDQEHTKFAEEFEATLRILARFTTAADRHVPYLIRKAEKIEEYLQQR